MNKKIRHLVARPIAATLALICTIPTAHAITPKTGAIYFNGWGDSHHEIGINNGNLIKSWPERQPVWNYYSNSVSYMEDEIDAAVNIGGIDFFAFLYYPALDGQVDGNYLSNPRNKCFSNYFNASNHYDIEWCVFFSNHAPYQPDTAYWKQIINHLCGTGYFNNSRYLKVNGRPVIMVFDRANFNAEVRDYLRAKIVARGFPGCYIFVNGDSGGTGWDGHTRYNIQAGTGERTQADLRADNINWLNTGSSSDPVLAVAETNWDNRPWSTTPTRWYVGANAVEFEANLVSVKSWLGNSVNAGKFFSSLLLINAWNENGEGGFLIPSISEGSDYLKAVSKVMEGIPYARVTPVYPISLGRTEAESLGKGSTIVDENNASVSGGKFAKLNVVNDQGAIWGMFSGSSGIYSVSIRYYDEDDGASIGELYVAGKLAGSWNWNVNNNTMRTVTFTNISIKNRGIVKIISRANNGEHARIDYLEVQ